MVSLGLAPSRFEETGHDVRLTFTSLINEIHAEVFKDTTLDRMGSTLVLCFIDPKAHLVYTATLGDSEAHIYRKVEGQYVSIPLSCVRDWSSPKDAQRAAQALEDPSIATRWPVAKDPKILRVGLVNVSRGFGDKHMIRNDIGLSQKPKITVQEMLPDDILVLACDGLRDRKNIQLEKDVENGIIQIVENNPKNMENLADQLIKYALDPENPTFDNVSIVTIKAN